jgi:tetratricopeptide (TPR) repeat protein
VVSYLTLAGKSALGAAAFDEARRSFRTAVSHLDAADLRQRADLLASLAMAERGLDHWDMALAHLREVVEIYVNLGDPEKVGGSFAKLTGALISVGRFKEAIETAHRGLACLQADISAGRVRLLAGLAQALAGTGAYGPADEAMQEGLNIASRLSDPKLEARLLSVRSAINFLYFRLKEAAADALRSQQLGASEVSPWQRAIDLRILQQILVCLGSMEEALRIADELEPLARKIGQSYEVALCVSVRAWAEFAKAPDLAKLKIGLEQVPKSDQLSWFAYWETLSEVQLSLVDFFRGNWATALLHAQASCQLEVERVESSTRGLGVGTLFRQMAYAGDRAGAFGILEGNLALLPVIGHQNIRGSWWMLALVIEGLIALGEQSKAAPFYPLARELIGTGAVALWPVFRFTQTIAGIAAVAARQWEAAEEHFQIALQQAESLPNVFEQAEIRRFHAMMLIDRAAPGDRETARALLKEALETYTQIGMSRHLEMTQALLTRAAGR